MRHNRRGHLSPCSGCWFKTVRRFCLITSSLMHRQKSWPVFIEAKSNNTTHSGVWCVQRQCALLSHRHAVHLISRLPQGDRGPQRARVPAPDSSIVKSKALHYHRSRDKKKVVTKKGGGNIIISRSGNGGFVLLPYRDVRFFIFFAVHPGQTIRWPCCSWAVNK